jgi:hypothetical protein
MSVHFQTIQLTNNMPLKAFLSGWVANNYNEEELNQLELPIDLIESIQNIKKCLKHQRLLKKSTPKSINQFNKKGKNSFLDKDCSDYIISNIFSLTFYRVSSSLIKQLTLAIIADNLKYLSFLVEQKNININHLQFGKIMQQVFCKFDQYSSFFYITI